MIALINVILDKQSSTLQFSCKIKKAMKLFIKFEVTSLKPDLLNVA